MQLSYIIIPAILFLYSHISYRKYILYHIICIGAIGAYDTYLQYKNKQINNALDALFVQTIGINIFFILGFCFHLLCFIVIKDFYRYKNTNRVSFLLLGLANLVIVYLPYWPYYLEKSQVLVYYNSIYFLLMFANKLNVFNPTM
jgi:hypothetical protein